MDRRLRNATKRIRPLWLDLSDWRGRGDPYDVRLGRLPIRPALREERRAHQDLPKNTIDEARSELSDLLRKWRVDESKLAIVGSTGLGKSTFACEMAVETALQAGAGEDAILLVVHDKERVRATTARLRGLMRDQEGETEWIQPLLGRQDATAPLFGCDLKDVANRFGGWGRSVTSEVCKNGCNAHPTCDYWTHTKQARRARIVVTTAAKMACLTDKDWNGERPGAKRIGRVICDEDVFPALITGAWVSASYVKRVARWIRCEQARPEPSVTPRRLAALMEVLPYLTGILGVLDAGTQETSPLSMLMPEEFDRFMTSEGRRLLLGSLPLRPGGVPDSRWPAEWETMKGGRPTPQLWGSFVDALVSDMSVRENSGRASLVHVVPRSKGRGARLHIVRLEMTAIENLRARSVLVLDATLHPAICALLQLKRRVVGHRDDGPRVVQVLGPLLWQGELLTKDREHLTDRGQWALACAAAWIRGRVGYILCRKAVAEVLRKEAALHHELRRAKFVTPKRERGWDADTDAKAFVVLGRYAKNGNACTREAHAVRAALLAMDGSTAAVDALERQLVPEPFRGRGKAVRYRGELVERVISRGPEDALAREFQDADRIASVTQFVGRHREGPLHVLLLRGDPTIASDALVEAQDLAVAMPGPLDAGSPGAKPPLSLAPLGSPATAPAEGLPF